MTFAPRKGQHFYVAFRPRNMIVHGGMFDDKVVQQTDCSYRGDVFKCIALDDSYIVGHMASDGVSYQKNRNYMFPRSDVNFAPVGPDVMAVLGLPFQADEI